MITVTPDTVGTLAGTDLGTTEPFVIDQATIDAFADATGDRQWIHVDPDRAAAGPFGTTIAHGYLTLSLTPRALAQLVRFEGFGRALNYGCDRVRFPAPVPSGSSVRASATVDAVAEVTGGVQLTITLRFQVDGTDRPACVAEVLLRQLR